VFYCVEIFHSFLQHIHGILSKKAQLLQQHKKLVEKQVTLHSNQIENLITKKTNKM
jgi:hypothetical protein